MVGFLPWFPAAAGDSVDVAFKSSGAEWLDQPSLSVTGPNLYSQMSLEMDSPGWDGCLQLGRMSQGGIERPFLQVSLHRWHLPCGLPLVASHVLAAGSHHSPFCSPLGVLFSSKHKAKVVLPCTGMPSQHPKAECSSGSPHVGIHQWVWPLHDRLWQAGSWVCCGSCWRLWAAGALPPPEVAQSDALPRTHTHTHSACPWGGLGGSGGCVDQACSSLSRFSSCNWMRTFRLFTTSTSCFRISCSAFSSSGVFRVSSLFM